MYHDFLYFNYTNVRYSCYCGSIHIIIFKYVTLYSARYYGCMHVIIYIYIFECFISLYNTKFIIKSLSFYLEHCLPIYILLDNNKPVVIS